MKIMQKVELQYILNTTPSLLYKQISTPEGLATWFADDVVIHNDLYVFKWRGYEEAAKCSFNSKKMYVKIDWVDEDKMLEFSIEKNAITNDLILSISDNIEDDDNPTDAQMLWDSQIKLLKRRLGII
jgi:hypothetical protein